MLAMMKNSRVKAILGVTLGTAIMVVGLYFFVIPAHIMGGGAGGLALILEAFLPIPYSVVYLAVNTLLLVVGLLTLGRSFSGLTLYCIVLSSIGFWLCEQFFPLSAPLSEDMIVNCMVGTLISATGIGITYNAGGSSGGTDIIARIMSTYTKMEFSSALLLVDGLVLLGAFGAFGMYRGLYAFLNIIINATVIKWTVMGGEELFEVTIISDYYEEINQFIFKHLDHSSTMIPARGSYTQKDRWLVLTVIDGQELLALKHFVQELDDKAFMYVNAVSEVSGLGFTYKSSISRAPDEYEYDPMHPDEESESPGTENLN